jgi:hypothetical protein
MAKAIEKSPKDAERYATLWDIAAGSVAKYTTPSPWY